MRRGDDFIERDHSLLLQALGCFAQQLGGSGGLAYLRGRGDDAACASTDLKTLQLGHMPRLSSWSSSSICVFPQADAAGVEGCLGPAQGPAVTTASLT